MVMQRRTFWCALAVSVSWSALVAQGAQGPARPALVGWAPPDTPPIAYFTGDKAKDVAFPNAADDFERITNVPVLFAWRDTLVHAGTYREANGGELGRIAVAYLAWRLKGDVQAGRTFTGADCGLCQDARWHVSKKRVD
jgi:hypothetical protein